MNTEQIKHIWTYRSLALAVLILCSAFPCAKGQELNISFEMGPGQYKMSDLKEYNIILKRIHSLDSKIVSDFPVYYYYNPNISFSLKKVLAFGLNYNFQSTGSRIARADYSGYFYVDTEVHSGGIGGFFEIFVKQNHLRVAFRNGIGQGNTKLLIRESVSLTNSYQYSSKIDYKTDKSFYYFPAAVFAYDVSFFRISLIAGYYTDLIKKELKASVVQAFSKDYIELMDGKHATQDWSGFRFGASVSFDILHLHHSGGAETTDN